MGGDCRILVGCVRGRQALGGEAEGWNFQASGVNNRGEKFLFLSVKNSKRETLMLLIAAEGYRTSVLVRVTERSRRGASNPLSVKHTVQLT